MCEEKVFTFTKWWKQVIREREVNCEGFKGERGLRVSYVACFLQHTYFGSMTKLYTPFHSILFDQSKNKYYFT